MKVALIFPHFNCSFGERCPSIGLAYIASYLRKNNIDARIFDGTFHSPRDILRQVLEYNPDIAGISVQTATAEYSFDLAGKMKEKNKNITIVFGGPHPTIVPEETMKNKDVDTVVVGEGEETMLDVCKNLHQLEKVKGIWFKQDGNIIKNPERELIKNLDALPFPAYDLLNDEYFKDGGVIMCSRGCAFNCSFCQPTLRKLFGNAVRFRSAKNIIEEIEFLIKKYNIKHFLFHDDTFTVNKAWVKELCNEILEHKLNIKWICKGRINTVDRELLKIMKDAGCTDIEFGVESGSEKIRNTILNKNISNELIINVFNMCKEVGIDTTAFLMVGSPHETKETIEDTIELVKIIKPLHNVVSITTPLIGTNLYDYCIENNLLIPASSWSDYKFSKKILIKNDNLTEDDLRYFFHKLEFMGYKNYIIDSIKKLKIRRLYTAILNKIKQDNIKYVKEL